MPLTFPAHQALVLPLKQRWPHRLDGVALVIGTAAPDLHRGVDPLWDSLSTHSALGITIFTVPFSLLYATVLRRWGLPGFLRFFPANSRFRRYRNIAPAGPGLLITIGSIYLGAFLHLLWDVFTSDDEAVALWPGSVHRWPRSTARQRRWLVSPSASSW